MATAKDYDINLPYGATSSPYSSSHPHRGNDRPCPAGTPIVIGGTQIGLTGATGYVFGAHLHIQEWNGSYSNVRKPQNEFKPGTVIGVYPNSAGDGTFGKFIDIRNDDGWVDSYCHLSRIDVRVGDIIGGVMDTVDRGGLETIWKLALDRAPTDADYKSFVGKPWPVVLFTAYSSPEYKARYAGLVGKYEFWKQAQALLGDDVTKENMEAKMKAKYGSGGDCTPDERAYLDSMYKIVDKKG